MLAIETAGCFVRIEQHRLLVVDAEGIFIIIGSANSGPAQVLRNAARIAPPVREAQLDAQAITRRFRQDLIEKDELSFVPFVRCVAKRVCPWPVIKICNWLHVTRPALTGGPHAHDLDANLRRLPQGFRHVCAIVVAIHYGDVCAHEPERLAIDHKSQAVRLHKAGPSARHRAAPTRNRKQNRRACN